MKDIYNYLKKANGREISDTMYESLAAMAIMTNDNGKLLDVASLSIN